MNVKPFGDGTENQPHDDRTASVHNDHSGTQRDIKIFQKLRNHCGHGIAVGRWQDRSFDMSISFQCRNQLRIVSCNTHKKAIFRIQNQSISSFRNKNGEPAG